MQIKCGMAKGCWVEEWEYTMRNRVSKAVLDKRTKVLLSKMEIQSYYSGTQWHCAIHLKQAAASDIWRILTTQHINNGPMHIWCMNGNASQLPVDNASGSTSRSQCFSCTLRLCAPKTKSIGLRQRSDIKGITHIAIPTQGCMRGCEARDQFLFEMNKAERGFLRDDFLPKTWTRSI